MATIFDRLRDAIAAWKNAPVRRRRRGPQSRLFRRNAQILEMFMSGNSAEKIGATFNLSGGWVRRILRRMEAERAQQHGRRRP
jgi:DNA invertase Pin-like site-specific DNA recombinase